MAVASKKGYYSFIAFSRLAELGSQVKAETDDPAVWCVSVADESGSKYATMIVYYEDNDGVTKPKDMTIRSESGEFSHSHILLLDKDHDLTEITPESIKGNEARILMPPNSVVLIRNY